MSELPEENLKAIAEGCLLLVAGEYAPNQERRRDKQDSHERRGRKLSDKCCELFACQPPFPIRLERIEGEIHGFGEVRQDRFFIAECG